LIVSIAKYIFRK